MSWEGCIPVPVMKGHCDRGYFSFSSPSASLRRSWHSNKSCQYSGATPSAGSWDIFRRGLAQPLTGFLRIAQPVVHDREHEPVHDVSVPGRVCFHRTVGPRRSPCRTGRRGNRRGPACADTSHNRGSHVQPAPPQPHEDRRVSHAVGSERAESGPPGKPSSGPSFAGSVPGDTRRCDGSHPRHRTARAARPAGRQAPQGRFPAVPI